MGVEPRFRFRGLRVLAVGSMMAMVGLVLFGTGGVAAAERGDGQGLAAASGGTGFHVVPIG